VRTEFIREGKGARVGAAKDGKREPTTIRMGERDYKGKVVSQWNKTGRKK